MGLLDGKVAIITGGTRGIGYYTAVEMARQGAVVYACARHERAFSDERILYHYLDVTDLGSCQALMDDVSGTYGKIDILVANAGITGDALTSKMTEDRFDSVINTNLKGVYNSVRMIGPWMERQGYGAIVTVSSVVGEQGNIGQVNYAASKAAVIGMTRVWAKEFPRKGAAVRVNSIAPGFTDTDMVKSVRPELLEKIMSQTMLKRLARPQEIASAIVFLASDMASYITGTVLDVNGGISL